MKVCETAFWIKVDTFVARFVRSVDALAKGATRRYARDQSCVFPANSAIGYLPS